MLSLFTVEHENVKWITTHEHNNALFLSLEILFSSLFHWIFTLTTGWKMLNACQHLSWRVFNEWKRSLHVTGSKESSLQIPSVTAWTPSFTLFSSTMCFAVGIVVVGSSSWWPLWVSMMSHSGLWPPQTSGLLSETSGKVLHTQTHTNRSMNTHNTKAMGEGWEISRYNWSLLRWEFWV